MSQQTGRLQVPPQPAQAQTKSPRSPVRRKASERSPKKEPTGGTRPGAAPAESEASGGLGVGAGEGRSPDGFDGEESEYEVEIEEEGLEVEEDVVELIKEHHRKSTWDHHSLARLKEGEPSISSGRRGTCPGDKGFTRLQAILTDLPKHALQSDEASTVRSCSSCGVQGPVPLLSSAEAPSLSCACVVEMALVQAITKYPLYADELARLVVAHASPDVAIFVDHEKQRIFTSVRGTCPTSARDLGNDALIVFGVTPARVYYVRHTYASIRKLYPKYESFGCGHSLGGSIMHDLAHGVEEEPELRFDRVDVFNAGGSPFRKNYSALNYTEFNAHRVAGDIVSYFYQPPGAGGNSRGGRTIQHDLDPKFMAHGLGHFLPKRRSTLGRFMSRGLNVMWGGWLSCSCSGRTPSIR